MNIFVAITVLAFSIPVFTGEHHKNLTDNYSSIFALFVPIGLVLFIIVSYKNRQNEIRFIRELEENEIRLKREAKENEIRLKREAEENEIRLKREAEESLKREAWIKHVKLDSKGLIASCIAIGLNGGLIGVITFGFIGYLFSELWMYFSSGITGILWIDSCGIIGFILGLIFAYRYYYEYYHHCYFLYYCHYIYYRYHNNYNYNYNYSYYDDYYNDDSERLDEFKGNKKKQAFILLSLLIIIIVGRIKIVERYKELRMARLIQNLSEVFLGLFNWLSGLFHGLSGLFHGLLHKLSNFFDWLYLFHFFN